MIFRQRKHKKTGLKSSMAVRIFFLYSPDCSKRPKIEYSYWKCVSRHICSLTCGFYSMIFIFVYVLMFTLKISDSVILKHLGISLMSENYTGSFWAQRNGRQFCRSYENCSGETINNSSCLSMILHYGAKTCLKSYLYFHPSMDLSCQKT